MFRETNFTFIDENGAQKPLWNIVWFWLWKGKTTIFGSVALKRWKDKGQDYKMLLSGYVYMIFPNMFIFQPSVHNFVEYLQVSGFVTPLGVWGTVKQALTKKKPFCFANKGFVSSVQRGSNASAQLLKSWRLLYTWVALQTLLGSRLLYSWCTDSHPVKKKIYFLVT